MRRSRFLPFNTFGRLFSACLFCAMAITPLQGYADDDIAVFAVVSEEPKDKVRVSAKALIDGIVSDTKLLPSETVLGNPIWRTLEICHAMKLEGSKTAEGFKVTSARILNASMLPMTLQGFAGDCLIKKAVEIAPLVD
ncbi:MAG TPA: hypothetical protein VFG71_14305 [Nitrospiraceae bacterium]|nr:hypothetical protein [Nitrospiraceae bacterium]